MLTLHAKRSKEVMKRAKIIFLIPLRYEFNLEGVEGYIVKRNPTNLKCSSTAVEHN